ncbi:hypothetical protein HPB51_029573 [Rhipicephalus microplus]|uniref:Uncharacterized protein n=1 Tax=Rhipicephalus microplus TaxID=6941 RepID=A0A9J6CTX2_RHIMP|nr:hypothetical protein HPB51_029573 [Rhipicephalus microplus]
MKSEDCLPESNATEPPPALDSFGCAAGAKLVFYDGALLDVGKLLRQVERSERARTSSETRLKELIEALAEVRESWEASRQEVLKTQIDLDQARRQLVVVEDDLCSSRKTAQELRLALQNCRQHLQDKEPTLPRLDNAILLLTGEDDLDRKVETAQDYSDKISYAIERLKYWLQGRQQATTMHAEGSGSGSSNTDLPRPVDAPDHAREPHHRSIVLPRLQIPTFNGNLTAIETTMGWMVQGLLSSDIRYPSSALFISSRNSSLPDIDVSSMWRLDAIGIDGSYSQPLEIDGHLSAFERYITKQAAICGIEFCVLGAMAPPSVSSREPGGMKKCGKYTTLTMEKKAAIIKLIESGRSQLDVAEWRSSSDDNDDRPQPSAAEIANAVTILSSVYGDDVTLAQIRANQIASKRSLRQGSIKDFFKPA